jgi:uncharacterized protein
MSARRPRSDPRAHPGLRASGASAPARRPPPIGDADIDALQALLDALPPPLEPLDVSMLDGYLCAVLLQPQDVPLARWLAHVTDVDGRALPAGVDVAPLRDLVVRRHAELERAIRQRQWFDPWVFELDTARGGADPQEASPAAFDAVYPWVAGFATALELFPRLMAWDPAQLNEPLALVYQHLQPDDLEDADALRAQIESLQPPLDLGEAVESLVRGVLLLADVSRPLASAPSALGARPRSRRR